MAHIIASPRPAAKSPGMDASGQASGRISVWATGMCHRTCGLHAAALARHPAGGPGGIDFRGTEQAMSTYGAGADGILSDDTVGCQ